jgi:hypothetical protein
MLGKPPLGDKLRDEDWVSTESQLRWSCNCLFLADRARRLWVLFEMLLNPGRWTIRDRPVRTSRRSKAEAAATAAIVFMKRVDLGLEAAR